MPPKSRIAYNLVADAVEEVADVAEETVLTPPSIPGSGTAATSAASASTASTTAAAPVVTELDEEYYGPLEESGKHRFTREFLAGQERFTGAQEAAKEAARRRYERRPVGRVRGADWQPRDSLPDIEWTSDPEIVQMYGTPASGSTLFSGPKRAVSARPVRAAFVPKGSGEIAEAEEALRETPPFKGAEELSGFGPGDQESSSVKMLDPSPRVKGPAAPGARLGLIPTSSQSDTVSYLKRTPVEGAVLDWPIPPKQMYRPEGGSWFVAPEPDTRVTTEEGRVQVFDADKARTKLLAPVSASDASVSGGMHFGHTMARDEDGAPIKGEFVEPDKEVFSTGPISLPRLAGYQRALIDERARQSKLLWRGDARVEEELRRLDRDVNQAKRLDIALRSVAKAAGISRDEIETAVAAALEPIVFGAQQVPEMLASVE